LAREPINVQMIEIPAGQIELRDDRKKTHWTVSIEPFLMSQFLVTQQIYAEVMSLNPAKFQGIKKPVESVSWFDAVQFCNTLSEQSGLAQCYRLEADGEPVELIEGANGYRLPTDAMVCSICSVTSGNGVGIFMTQRYTAAIECFAVAAGRMSRAAA